MIKMPDKTDFPLPTRRQALGALGAVAAVAGVAACNDNTTNKPAEGTTIRHGDVNGLTDNQAGQTIDGYDGVITNPECQYPVLKYSLELSQQRRRLLTTNIPGLNGFAYLFTANGQLIAEFPVVGKVSSTQSSMTASTGVYKDRGGSGGGNVPVELPGDDLSFGPNEGGDSGKFFFTDNDALVFWDGPILYTTSRMNVLANPNVIAYDAANKPTVVVK